MRTASSSAAGRGGAFSLSTFAQTEDLFLASMQQAGEAEAAKALTFFRMVVSPSEETEGFVPDGLCADSPPAQKFWGRSMAGLTPVTC
ncbi:hypothetical protein XI07_04170 [Bradyrhizobium sp. CCBAU 11445]|uniref:hypothetical protein n=1 Tax=Bradyrhizobium sp. CCBAU 11445 TaxID=1630896 RepID=UPI00230671C3|nr:hypothetical protein [Bradyrhizobium sp. CCBAU 11445]MDA9481242.1 hypothetical protein [Bradyrhizobium sp. CCBAU 11445]